MCTCMCAHTVCALCVHVCVLCVCACVCVCCACVCVCSVCAPACMYMCVCCVCACVNVYVCVLCGCAHALTRCGGLGPGPGHLAVWLSGCLACLLQPAVLGPDSPLLGLRWAWGQPLQQQPAVSGFCKVPGDRAPASGAWPGVSCTHTGTSALAGPLTSAGEGPGLGVNYSREWQLLGDLGGRGCHPEGQERGVRASHAPVCALCAGSGPGDAGCGGGGR